MSSPHLSRWLTEMQRYLAVNTLFLLHGNVHDQLVYPACTDHDKPEELQYLPLRQLVHRFLRDRHYGAVAFYDMVDGCSFLCPAERQLYESGSGDHPVDGSLGSRRSATPAADVPPGKDLPERKLRTSGPESLDGILDAFRLRIQSSSVPLGLVVEHASRLLPSPGHLEQRERRQFVKVIKAAQEASRRARGYSVNHAIVLVCNRLNELPAWLFLDNSLARPIEVPLPSAQERRLYFQMAVDGFVGSDEAVPQERTRLLEAFVDLTRGFRNHELEALRVISVRENLPFSSPKQIVERYKFGVSESPWESLSRGPGRARLAGAEEALRLRVKGQDAAIRAVGDIIKRAASGLSGIHHSASAHKPKGILFFAGPTGVGKTETAKALAELLFGTEDACIRFDMSEYSQEHSDQRLLGAPPGYVGYEEGGQLTNRLKESPFAVLLFDEIEKAHPKIMDKFLQILEDGRMTDGKGETVYFSEAVIVFTSNIGAYIDVPVGQDRLVRRPNILPFCWCCRSCGEVLIEQHAPDSCSACGSALERSETPYRLIRERMMTALENHFKLKLGRPEIYNRIGNNFVVFDYIRPAIARQIIDKILGNIKQELLGKKRLSLELADEVIEFLAERAMSNVEQGGRGIGNLIETALVNPLARMVFDQSLEATHLEVLRVAPGPLGEADTYDLEVKVRRT